MAPAKTCSQEGCDKNTYAKSACRKHYLLQRDVDPAVARCTISGCARAIHSNNLCNAHASARWAKANVQRVRALARTPVTIYNCLCKADREYGRETTITADEVTEKRRHPCEYCGTRLLSEASHSLDHKDPNGPSSVENLVPCCIVCNQIKGNWFSYRIMKAIMAVALALGYDSDAANLRARASRRKPTAA